MSCKFSRSDHSYSNDKVSHLKYHARYAKEEDFNKIDFLELDTPPCSNLGIQPSSSLLRLDIVESVGTTKYIAIFSPISTLVYQTDIYINIKMAHISFPYMMYEGNSCMYGGIYLIRKSSLEDSELLSYCTPNKTGNLEFIVPGNDFLIIIIHYRGYSAHRIVFEARFELLFGRTFPVDLMITSIRNKTAAVTNMNFGVSHGVLYFQSNLLNLRKISYVKIILQFEYTVKYLRFYPEEGDSCIYCTISYIPHRSNIKPRQHNAETLNKAFERIGIIQSVLISVSSCDVFTIPIWSFVLGNDRTQWNRHQTIQVTYNSTYYLFVSPFFFFQ